jgi:tetratricopeptide (TPR) repeat protein
VSRGRLALLSDNRTKVNLAKEAYESSVRALALDAKNDVAQHLMGRWHYEMAQIPFIARALIQVLFGTALPEGTYRDALTCFTTAMERNPQRIMHRVEAGRVHLKLGNRDEALRLLESAFTLEKTDINDHLTLQDAEKMLRDLKRSAAVPPFKPPQI